MGKNFASDEKRIKKIWVYSVGFRLSRNIVLDFYVGININSILLAFQKIDLDGTKTFAGFANFKYFIESIKSNPIVGTSLKIRF